MTIYAKPGDPFDAILNNAPPGLVGTMAVRIRNPDTQVDVVARTTAGITEQPAGSGIYVAALTAPTTARTYLVIWDNTSTFESEELVVTYTLPSSVAPGATLCDLTQLEEILGTTGSANTALKNRLLTVCSEHVMNHCRRRFLPSSVVATKRFRIRPGANMISLVPWDFQAGQSLTVVLDPTGANQTLVLEDDFYIAPENDVWGMADRLMLQARFGGARVLRVDVTATYGWASIPQPVSEATAYWIRDIIRDVSAFPQGQQMEQAEQVASDGIGATVFRQMLSPFKHQVLA